jgi:two-component system sensor histidine kinase UhpB
MLSGSHTRDDAPARGGVSAAPGREPPPEGAAGDVRPRPRFLRGRLRRERPGYRRLSLQTRVVLINAGVLVAAAALLALTPATVSFPLAAREGIVLGLGLVAIAVANVFLLRVSFRPLERLVARMKTVDLLQPGQRLELSGGVEVRQLIGTFNEMLDNLERERQESNRRALTAREAEARRIGHELHDEIGQRLTGVLLQLKRALESDGGPTRAELVEAQELVRSTLDEVGQIAWRLRPGILDDLGLVRALVALRDDLAERADAELELRIADPIPSLGGDCDLTIYRIAQESVTNALRHSHAGRIRVELTARDGGVRLDVSDNGRGLAYGAVEGAGIRGMRERALLVGAALRIESEPGEGVSVTLDVPRPKEEA